MFDKNSFRKEPGGGILFNIDTGDIQVAEGVAFGICDLIDMNRSRSQILAELKKKYPDEPDLEGDLDEFIRDLKEKGVLS